MTDSSHTSKQSQDLVEKKAFLLPLLCASGITRELREKEQKRIKPAAAHTHCLGTYHCSDQCNYKCGKAAGAFQYPCYHTV